MTGPVMSESFDPYRVSLGIPPESRPPTHYQLLGISPDETEQAVIEAAVLRQSGYVRNFQLGKYAKDATKILNEIAAAKACLLDAAKRAKYDAELRTHQPVAHVPANESLAALLPPAIDLDQLATPAATVHPVASASRGRQRRLAPSSKRKPDVLWQFGVAGAVVLALALILFMGVFRQSTDRTSNEHLAANRVTQANPEAGDASVSEPAEKVSEPVVLSGTVVPTAATPPEVRGDDHVQEPSTLTLTPITVAPGSNLDRPSQNSMSSPVSQKALELLGRAVAWYRAEGDADDFAGKHHGKLSRDAAIIPIEAGHAFDFDGDGDFVEVPDAPELNPSEAFTLMAWVRPRFNKDCEVVISKIDASPGAKTAGYQFGLGPNHCSIVVQFNAPGEPWAANSFGANLRKPISNGEWRHAAVTFDGETLRAYDSGDLVGSLYVGRKAVASSPAKFCVGGGNGQDGCSFPGAIDDAALFNQALNDTEIRDIYLGTQLGKVSAKPSRDEAPHPLPKGIGWYRGDGDASDSAGTNHGILKGSVKFGPGMLGKAFRFDGGGSVWFNGPFILNRVGDASLTLCVRFASRANEGEFDLVWGREDGTDENPGPARIMGSLGSWGRVAPGLAKL
jgi:hypothetical protein